MKALVNTLVASCPEMRDLLREEAAALGLDVKMEMGGGPPKNDDVEKKADITLASGGAGPGLADSAPPDGPPRGPGRSPAPPLGPPRF